MEDVNISIYRASVVREGSTPASPGFVVSDGQNPVDPSGSGQNHLPVTIATAATGLSITESQILSGAGLVSQYIRGDGSLADFPATTGGGSSVSYYLNGSVSQGTIGGVAYKQLNRTPVFGAGTDISINADGYIASFITDASDPNKLLIPAGNWNFETYFSASSNGGSPSFYVELYKYDGTTFTLIATSSSAPELIAFGTSLNPYYSTLAVPQTALALTDRLAIRYFVTHSGRTITLHTEDNHLCQIITTFTTGLTALNGLTAQVQNFAVGTSGTDFAIASATATHTFNLPTASATNRGALSSADWTTFNNKTSNLGTVTSVGLSSATSGVTIGSTPVTTSGTITLAIATASGSQNGLLSSTDWTTFNGKQNALTNPVTGTGTSGQVAYFTGTTAISSESNLFWDATNDRLGIGTNIPANTLDLLATTTPLRIVNTLLPANQQAWIKLRQGTNNLFGADIGIDTTTGGDFVIGRNNATDTFTETFRIVRANGNVLINSQSDNGARLQVSGTVTSGYIQTNAAGGAGNQEGLRIVNNNAYLSFFNSANTTRSAYIQGNTTDLTINTSLAIPILFGTSNVTKMTLFDTGNLLVGTGSDNGAKLQVSGTATISGNVTIGQATAATNVKLIFNGVASKAAGIEFHQSGTPQWYIGNGIASEDNNFELYNSNGTMAMKIIKSTNAINFIGAATFTTSVSINTTNAYGKFQTKVATDANFYLTNYNAGEVAVQFTNDANSLQCKAQFYASQFVFTTGNVGINTDTPANKLDVQSTTTPVRIINTISASNQQAWIKLRQGTNNLFGADIGIDTTTGGDFVIGRNDGSDTFTEAFRIVRASGNAKFSSLGTGTVTATAGVLSTVSDLNYKIEDGFIDSAIKKVLNLKPRYFYWNEKSGLPKDVRQLGFYAQEVNEALGEEAANKPKNENTPWGISDRSMIAYLTKAIQELKQEIDTLKN